MLRPRGSEKEYFMPSGSRTTLASWVTMSTST